MDNCEEQRILDMINKNKKCCRPCFGPTGPTGATGPQGEAGAAGADAETPTISIGTVTTGDPGTQAAASITGTAPNYILNLTIPQGPTGQNV